MTKIVRALVILSLLLTGVSLLFTGYSMYKMRRLAAATSPQARQIAAGAVAGQPLPNGRGSDPSRAR
jgi:hypothetical protein